MSKCTFAADQVNYLGHVISDGVVQAEPDKLEAIQQWPAPVNFTNLRGFLGPTGYYRRFIPNYASIAAGLIDILRQPKFMWTPEAAASYAQLKDAMTKLATVTLLDFTHPFDVTTDASNIAIGAVLSQKDQPIAFFSKRFCPRMQAASAYVHELFAITEAVKKWRQYLVGRKFRIFTDQRSLKHLLSQVVQTPEQYKWATKLLGYDFEIIYKPGKENLVANALSRIDQPHLLPFLLLTQLGSRICVLSTPPQQGRPKPTQSSKKQPVATPSTFTMACFTTANVYIFRNNQPFTTCSFTSTTPALLAGIPVFSLPSNASQPTSCGPN